jgi:glutathione S-transferase
MAFGYTKLSAELTTIKLIFQTHSPYARKILVAAHELSLIDGIELSEHAAGSLRRDTTFMADPFGKCPLLICDDGLILFESVVICEYLDELHTGTSLIPSADPHRWLALRLQAIAQGIADAGIALRCETEQHPPEGRRGATRDDQMEQLITWYTFLEREVDLSGRVNSGQIAVATALSWIEFHQLSNFREGRPKLTHWFDTFVQRPSMQATGYQRES